MLNLIKNLLHKMARNAFVSCNRQICQQKFYGNGIRFTTWIFAKKHMNPTQTRLQNRRRCSAIDSSSKYWNGHKLRQIEMSYFVLCKLSREFYIDQNKEKNLSTDTFMKLFIHDLSIFQLPSHEIIFISFMLWKMWRRYSATTQNMRVAIIRIHQSYV